MKLYNSLTNQKEEFKPLNPKEVKLYVCGITPYDTTHLGHAFVYVAFDAFVRFLKFKGFKVTYTQNVTDIDDDLLKRAKEEGRDWRELGDFWTNRFLKDMTILNIQLPSNYVKATQFIDKIIEIIQKLLDDSFAYRVDGNIYFEVSKFPDYGKLSKFTPDQMKFLLKERGGDPSDPKKKAPLDFLLWQKSLYDEASWDSSWGRGRPGWHIECSAMISKTLGEQIDIHGGGRDLIYPHHESEIAQSESYTGKSPFVKYWMHIGMVMYQGEKMSKSLGNLVLVSDLLKKYSPNAVRWLLLGYYYRRPWEFDFTILDECQIIVREIEEKLKKVPKTSQKHHFENNPELESFLESLEDDFCTPIAFSEILTLINKKNPPLKSIKQALEMLGFKFD